MRSRPAALLLSFVLLGTLQGCFTETGNPGDNENAVRAKFYIDYDTPAPVSGKSGLGKTGTESRNLNVTGRDTIVHITSFFMTIGDAEFDTDLGDTDFFAGKAKPLVDFTVPKTLLWIKPDA